MVRRSALVRSSARSAQASEWLSEKAHIPAVLLPSGPGGSPAAAHLHLARTVSRRAERLMVQLAGQPDEIVGTAALHYVNRLSDFFFVAARWVNDCGAADVLWVPGRHTKASDAG